MAEVLAAVKRHFGKDAVILNTRTMTRGGVFGIGGNPGVEITAARSMGDLPQTLKRGTLKPSSRLTGHASAEGAAPTMPAIASVRATPQTDTLMSEVSALRDQVSELIDYSRQGRMGEMPSHLYDTYKKLTQRQVADKLAQQLVSEIRDELSEYELHDASAVRKALGRKMEAMLPVAGALKPLHRGKPTIIALVGPTGVGKTTTIAKLAANLCLREHRKVGLITIDTYRIAAIEQLKIYANIIDVPLEVVMSPDHLQDAVARLADCEIILIDTAGRSQRDTSKLSELNQYFQAVHPDEIHLVLSSTGDRNVLLDTIDAFESVGIDRVIFTKLDEAVGFGVILACLQKADAQLSYLTMGQDVPDDIRLGERSTLVRLILGEQTAQEPDPMRRLQSSMLL